MRSENCSSRSESSLAGEVARTAELWRFSDRRGRHVFQSRLLNFIADAAKLTADQQPAFEGVLAIPDRFSPIDDPDAALSALWRLVQATRFGAKRVHVSVRASCGVWGSAASRSISRCSWCSTAPKGLRAAVRDVFGTRAVVQRCQWHKRENVVRYLPKALQPVWLRKLQAAYAQPASAAALATLSRLQRELRLLNASAAASLSEGLEETLTLHRLGVFRELGTSFKATNLIESVMARVEARSGRVTRWRTNDQKQRWCAAALLALETQFRRVKGHTQLDLLGSRC